MTRGVSRIGARLCTGDVAEDLRGGGRMPQGVCWVCKCIPEVSRKDEILFGIHRAKGVVEQSAENTRKCSFCDVVLVVYTLHYSLGALLFC